MVDFHPASISQYVYTLSGSRSAALVNMTFAAWESCRVRRMLLEAGTPVGTQAESFVICSTSFSFQSTPAGQVFCNTAPFNGTCAFLSMGERQVVLTEQ
jgi:hypothetical protein